MAPSRSVPWTVAVRWLKDFARMFENVVAQPIFPTTIWIHTLEPEAAGPLNAKLMRELDRLMGPRPPRAPGDAWQTDQVLHEVEEFQDLMTIFHTAAKGVLDRLEVEYGPVQITVCWANLNPKGAVHHSHNHPNNYLSGVYYVQVAPGSDAIQFHDPRSQVTMIAPRVKTYNLHNSVVANVRVRAGQLIIFPAWLVHSVAANMSDELRVSISFNIMFSDYVERVSKPKWGGMKLRTGEQAE